MSACMKKIREHIYIIGELALLVVLSAGWWGILYPGFSMTEETFEIAEDCAADRQERADGNAAESEKSRQHRTEGFFAMLEAAPDEIEIKSRFWEIILSKKE